jgi:hypothetical protein
MEVSMSGQTRAILFASAATAALLAAGFSQLAGAQPQPQDVVADLGNNEGVYIDAHSFKVARGQSKGDVSAQIAKLNAKEISPGAIVFRSGDKLYFAEGLPPGTERQGMKNFQDTFTLMKEFQDNWATSYMK